MFAVAALLTAGTQLVNGLALFAVLQSISAVSPSDVLFCIGVTSLAGVAGMIVVIAPAGLGVRDGVLVTLLSARIPLEFAALAAVFLRALSLVADLALAGAALITDVVASQHVASGAFSLRTPADPAAVEHAGATPEERAA
jgi:uncharacterized membrane protein YbhN (UPF0104 family)